MNPIWIAYNDILMEISAVSSSIAGQTGLPLSSVYYQFGVINRPAYTMIGNNPHYLVEIPKTNNLMPNLRSLANYIQKELDKRWLSGNSLAPFHINVVEIVRDGSQILMHVYI